MSKIDISKYIGMKSGMMTLVEDAGIVRDKNGKPRHKVVCVCDCGVVKNVDWDNFRSGKSTSCGCATIRSNSNRQKTHGESHTKLYNVWCSMKRRCDLKTQRAYKDYGGRGISVCDEWKNDYTSFRDWALSHGYAEGLTIDRINNNGNYEPSNCRWVPFSVQCNNRRSNILVDHNGESHSVAEWCRILNLSDTMIYQRIQSGMAGDRAIFG